MVWGRGFRVFHDAELMVLGFAIQGSGIRVLGLGCRDLGLGIAVLGLGCALSRSFLPAGLNP